MKTLIKFNLMWKDREGATMAEYAVIATMSIDLLDCHRRFSRAG